MKIILWTKHIDDLFLNKRNIGGITVQMSIWAKLFIRKEWKVYSFTVSTKKSSIRGIRFLPFPSRAGVDIFLEIYWSLYYILTIRPDVIFLRGASRNLYYVSLFARLTQTKVVFLGASNTDFQKGSELLKSKHDRILYQTGLKRMDHYIVQNIHQKESLIANYKKDNILTIPNIWISTSDITIKQIRKKILWVGNFRKLKRPEWFIELAKAFPEEEFIMVGAPYDKELFDTCKSMVHNHDNILILGEKSLEEVNELFSQSKLFVCTSETEGFPNTFLQAWENNIPVLSTFSPSGILEKEKVGIYVESPQELKDNLGKLLSNTIFYQSLQKNVANYFQRNHDAESGFEKVIKTFKIGQP